MEMALRGERSKELKSCHLDAIDVITLIAIILFARLGIRLFLRYRKMFRKNDNPED